MRPQPIRFHPGDRPLANVDLVLVGANRFSALVHELSERLFTMKVVDEGVGPFRARYETNIVNVTNPDDPIAEYARVIESLTPEAVAQWDGLSERTFHLGIRSGHGVGSIETILDCRSVAHVARLRGRILITTFDAMLKSQR